MRIQWYYNQFQVTTVVGIPGHIVKQEGKRIGKTFDHRNLPDPLYEQIKQLENNLKKRRTERLKMITLYNTLTRQKRHLNLSNQVR